MHDAAGALQARGRRNQRLDQLAVAEQDELNVGMPPKRQFGARNDHRCPVVAPHGVERDTDLLGHAATLTPAGRRRKLRPSKPG
jgi:hypothetical protein